MKKTLRNIALISGLTLLTPICFAKPFSAVIDLPGTTVVSPLQTEQILYDALPEGFTYDIQCTLTSDHKSSQLESYVKLFAGNGYFKFYINDKLLGGSRQATIHSTETNIIKVTGVYTDIFKNAFYIGNLDNTDTITVTGCQAAPSV